MKILLFFISPNKTTEKISREIDRRFSRDGHRVTLLNIGKAGSRSFAQVDPSIFEGVEILGIGSPVFHMRILEPMQKFLEEALPSIPPTTKAFIYLTYGGITSGKAFLNTATLLQRYHIPLVGAVKVWAPHFYNPVPYPDEAALQTIDAFCSRLSANHFTSTGWGKVKKTLSYQSRRVKIIYPLTELIGRLRQLPIEIDTQKCIRCKRCVNECPAGALEMAQYPIYHKQQCLYCYHCTTVCPQKAILCPTEQVAIMAEKNKKVIGCEQPANQIYLL